MASDTTDLDPCVGCAASDALDGIATALAGPDWEYPGQLVRDVQDVVAELRDLRRVRDALRVGVTVHAYPEGYTIDPSRAATKVARDALATIRKPPVPDPMVVYLQAATVLESVGVLPLPPGWGVEVKP